MQTTMQMYVQPKVKARKVNRTPRRTGDMKPLPLTDNQITWAIGHNLEWLLSIVKEGN